MSQVVGFRLDSDNPREAQALAVLKKGQDAGYSVRHILTEALLALEASAEEEHAAMASLSEMADALRQMEEALARLQSGPALAAPEPGNTRSNVMLTETFIESVKKGSKSGLRSE